MGLQGLGDNDEFRNGLTRENCELRSGTSEQKYGRYDRIPYAYHVCMHNPTPRYTTVHSTTG
jgi:hypothetical protein